MTESAAVRPLFDVADRSPVLRVTARTMCAPVRAGGHGDPRHGRRGLRGRTVETTTVNQAKFNPVGHRESGSRRS